MDGLGRAKHDARAESTKSRRLGRCMEQLPRHAQTAAADFFPNGVGTYMKTGGLNSALKFPVVALAIES